MLRIVLVEMALPDKFCPSCEQSHPRSCFGRNRQSPYGLHYYCKPCAASKQRAWAKAHPEKVRAMRADYLARVYAQNANRDPYES